MHVDALMANRIKNKQSFSGKTLKVKSDFSVLINTNNQVLRNYPKDQEEQRDTTIRFLTGIMIA